MKLAKSILILAIPMATACIFVSTNSYYDDRIVSQPDLSLQTQADMVEWNNDATSILTVGDNAIFVWQLSNEYSVPATLVSDVVNEVTSVAWSPSDRMIAIGYDNGHINVWDVVDQEIIADYVLNTKWIRSVSWSPNEKMLAVSDGDEASIISVRNTENIARFQNMTWLEWSPDGAVLLGREFNGDLLSFDADFLQPLSTIRHAILAEMNPNNATIAGISINTVTIWDLVSGQILIETNSQHNSPVWSVAWSPTGEFIASSSGRSQEEEKRTDDENAIRIWNATTGAMTAKLDGHQDSVMSVSWASAGDILSSYSLDGTIRVWNINTGTLEREIILPKNRYSIEFSSGGEKVAMTDSDGQVFIWKLQ